MIENLCPINESLNGSFFLKKSFSSFLSDQSLIHRDQWQQRLPRSPAAPGQAQHGTQGVVSGREGRSSVSPIKLLSLVGEDQELGGHEGRVLMQILSYVIKYVLSNNKVKNPTILQSWKVIRNVTWQTIEIYWQ